MADPPPSRRLYPVKEVAVILGVSKSTADELVELGPAAGKGTAGC